IQLASSKVWLLLTAEDGSISPRNPTARSRTREARPICTKRSSTAGATHRTSRSSRKFTSGKEARETCSCEQSTL
ncbi:uncharacterized protein B0H18DRAFT_990220, partial [Fomitopsis serialis]|uniref:uncharacterized protein n=1 Tax=Fomitopsis serialis TaxID=139415 RepID=UPI0020088CB7